MFKALFVPLIDSFSGFNIFRYITFRVAYAAITALFLSFVFGPKLFSLLRNLKMKQMVRDDGPKSHLQKSGTPTMGGVLIILSILISVILWMDFGNPYTWIGLLSMVGFGLIGLVDDLLKIFRKNSEGLHARFKIYGQVFVSTALVMLIYAVRGEYTSLLYLPFFKFPILDLSLLYVPFAVILLVGYSNAVNLSDGLDGLAAGLIILVGITLTFLTYLTGHFNFAEYLQIPFIPEAAELTILCAALVGATVGFLWYNAHPAEVFMGDTGSLSLGGLIGVIAMMIKKEILLIIIGGVFVLEALSVVIQVISYKLTGKRVFKMAPLHHHFELKGWAESKVVIRFWILGGLFAILSLSTLKFSKVNKGSLNQ